MPVRLRFIPICMILAMVSGGCRPGNSGGRDGMMPVSGSPSWPSPAAAGDGSNQWPFWPRAMRVHPASRIAIDREHGDEVIELRLQFRDSGEDIAKAVGRLSVDLFDAAATGRVAAIRSWEADLTDLALNNERFDKVTMTYLFRLPLGDAVLPAEPAVAVRLDSQDGMILTALATVRRQRTE
jgi:hypothetical protein